MSQQIKLILGLVASVVVNILLLIALFKPVPPPQDNRALEHELARKLDEINSYKKRIILLDIKVKESEVREDSLNKVISARKIKFNQDNEAVQLIPDDVLNDSVKSVLSHI